MIRIGRADIGRTVCVRFGLPAVFFEFIFTVKKLRPTDTGIPFDRPHIPVVVCVHLKFQQNLLEISGAFDAASLFPRRVQSGQQHTGKDCYYNNYDEELYQGKMMQIHPQNMNFPCVKPSLAE